MTNEEFMSMYEDSLRHGWVTSKIEAIRKKQKEREKQYNREYYRQHSEKWKKKHAYISEGARETEPSFGITPWEQVSPHVYERYEERATKTTDKYAERASELRKITAKYDAAVKEYVKNPTPDNQAMLEYWFNKYSNTYRLQKDDTKKSPSELASEAQRESAVRRRAINERMDYYKQNRSKLDAILDKADIVAESARRKIKKGANKVKKIFGWA